jgi:hypothetical protein
MYIYLDFVWRPVTLSADQLHLREAEVQDRTRELLEVADI